MEFLFPHQEPRKIQSTLMQQIYSCIENKQNLIAHAPTGIGKCVSRYIINLAGADGCNVNVVQFAGSVFCVDLSTVHDSDVAKLFHLPPLRNLSKWGIDKRNGFVARVAEVDEPFAVKAARHVFQYADASLVVFDQFVVGGEDARDALLNREREDGNANFPKLALLDSENGCA